MHARREPPIPTSSQHPAPLYEKLGFAADPVAVFDQVKHLPYPVLLDSSLHSPLLGRYSYVAAGPSRVLRTKGQAVELEAGDAVTKVRARPFDALRRLLDAAQYSRVPDAPPFQGGAMGYFAYELGRQIERLPSDADDDLGLPEMYLGFYDWVVAIDHLNGETWLFASPGTAGNDQESGEGLAWLRRSVERSRVSRPTPSDFLPARNLRSNFTRDAYIRAVRRVKDYIRAGDVYQVNLSQRFETYLRCHPWDLYMRLREASPAPFSAYLGFPEVAVVSSSPEQFLKVEGDTVLTRPMKGTRPRGATPEEDARLLAELRASEKDRAENVMIVDLLRNDLGRVCVPGSIEAPMLFTVEAYSTVYQMVSQVRGRLRPGKGALDLVQAAFPGGSVTGAPKIRAMQIIDELEPVERSVYCGAIGYIGYGGAMHLSIPIRTILVKDQRACFHVGGGIVADSDPQAEYEETLHKARGAMTALGL
ncbi:MAG: aminodeoxychorismate synthase component I [SAR202 cluster bacterium]|nr:aminodeoxychorismate synthase component I [SAR202 cluster bacterium]